MRRCGDRDAVGEEAPDDPSEARPGGGRRLRGLDRLSKRVHEIEVGRRGYLGGRDHGLPRASRRSLRIGSTVGLVRGQASRLLVEGVRRRGRLGLRIRLFVGRRVAELRPDEDALLGGLGGLGRLHCRCRLRDLRNARRRLGGALSVAVRPGPAGERIFRGPRYRFRVGNSETGIRRRSGGRSDPVQGPPGDRLVAPQRSAGETSALDWIPALVARVLAAGHAEVEGPVELLGDASGLTGSNVDAGSGHRIVHRSFVAHDEVLQALRQDTCACQRGPLRGRGTEGVAGATPLAIRVGEVAHLSSTVL